MADIEKWRNSQIAGLIKNDWTMIKSTDEHPELAHKNRAIVYYKNREGVLSSATLDSLDWNDAKNIEMCVRVRQADRLKEVFVYNSKNRVDVVSVICHVPPQVPEKDQIKFLDGFRIFCENKFGFNNSLAMVEHYHEHRPHGQFYFMPVVFDKKKQREKLSAKDVCTYKLYKTFHMELQKYMDNLMGYHVEIELDADNPRKNEKSKTINTLKDKTNKEEIKRLQNVIGSLESERNFFRKGWSKSETVLRALERNHLLAKAKDLVEPQDEVSEAVLNSRYETYHEQRVEAGRKRAQKARQRV